MTIFSVTNATQLQTALGTAIGGDTIVLASGNYGNVSIYNRNYASTVTIQTGNWTNRAHLDGLFVSNSKNITFKGLDLGRTLNAGETPEQTQLNWVRDSSNIRLNAVQIHGSRDDDPTNDGVGMVVTRVSGFRVDYSNFSELFRGIYVQQSSNSTILSNAFETIRSDGVVAAANNGMLIDGNSMTDFRPVLGDHADGIQFWNTSQTVGSSNVTIRNNVIAPGQFSGVEGEGVQGIFVWDPGTLGYKNFVIQNNLVYSHGAWNGISVNGVAGAQIVGNTLLSQSGDNKNLWVRAENSSSVTIRGNLVEDVLLKNVTGLIDSGNIDLSNTPALRSLIPNLDAPEMLGQLITPGYGFQLPAATNSAAYAELMADASASYTPRFGLNLEAFTALP
jgi:hypothetical protein